MDWILGEEGTATSSFNKIEQSLIQEFLMDGGKLFISGSEIGYDLSEKGDEKDKLFYEKFLRAEYKADAAGGKQGNYNIIGTQGSLFEGLTFSFDDGEEYVGIFKEGKPWYIIVFDSKQNIIGMWLNGLEE